MRTAAWVSVVVVGACCVLFAMWMMARWQRCRRALDEWRARWERGEKLCAVCAESFEAGEHAESDYDEATLKRWGKHRFVPARLVAEPLLLPREGPGRDR